MLEVLPCRDADRQNRQQQTEDALLSCLSRKARESFESVQREKEVIEIRPQPGPQTAFLSCPADVAVFGGSAGGGKTLGLLLEASRNISNPDYGGVIFRREQTMITNEGGLRDTALQLYPHLGGEYRSQPYPHFLFPSGARISFRHLNQESDVLSWQGSQIPLSDTTN